MGKVYKGRDSRLDRIVAIKVLPEELASDPQFRERFEREARSVGSLNHPHICTLHDVGRHDGVDFLVMEYLEGETLQDRLRRGPIPVAEALQISTAGGTAPRGRKDGNELFFIDPAGMLMSVPVLRGARFDVGVPEPLFDLQAIPSDGWNYAVSADGQRILAARATDAGATPITVVVNWPSLLNKPSGP
jgi:hypothetical protein